MTQPTEGFSSSGEINPAGFAEAITPADVPLPTLTRAIYVGVSGNLVVKMAGGSNIVTFTDVPGGSIVPIRVSEIRAATTALAIVALY